MIRSLRALALAALSLASVAGGALAHDHSAPPAANAPAAPNPDVTDRLVLLSTTDVQGKTGPCGCRIPAGGFARRAGFADSLRRQNPNVLVVDNGGWFPDQPDHEPNANFMVDAMGIVGVQVAGLGDGELFYGRSFLLATLARARFDVVCANLWDVPTKKRVGKPWTIVEVGGHKVGVFGVLSQKLGQPRAGDSLAVSDPVEAARKAVAELRKAGAGLVVALSSLGKADTEDLVTTVPGIDVAIAGRRVPPVDQGRKVAGAMVVYGGDQAHYMARTDVGFDAEGHPVEIAARCVSLAPEIPEHAQVAATVKAFEAAFKDRLLRLQNERAAKAAAADSAAIVR